MSRVLALRNLAEALAHSEPHESSALYGLALAVLDADELDTPMRCTIDNGMGYALRCGGDIEGARLKLGQALTEARRVASQRVELYARFNLSIIDELSGDLAQADARLRAVEADAQRYDVEGLAAWARIRLAWLQLKAGARAAARTTLRQTFASPPGIRYRDAVAALSAILDLEERRPSSRAKLSALAAAYRRRGDALTDFTLTLWVAHADALGGRVAAARGNVTRACTLGSERGFRVGTNWRALELVTVARDHVSAELAAFVIDSLRHHPQRRHLKVARSSCHAMAASGSTAGPATSRPGVQVEVEVVSYDATSAHCSRHIRRRLAEMSSPTCSGRRARATRPCAISRCDERPAERARRCTWDAVGRR